jgi:hypothetical protein
MKVGDKVRLFITTKHHPRGVVGAVYTIADVLKTEIMLCTEGELCFYTQPDNVIGIKDTMNSTYPLKRSDYDIDTVLEVELEEMKIKDKLITESREENNKNEAFAANLDAIIKDISDLLKSKNKAYGNSALKPAKIFSQLDATESLCARIDDKLMRIKNRGITDATEDTVDDLIGYLLLLKMSL